MAKKTTKTAKKVESDQKEVQDVAPSKEQAYYEAVGRRREASARVRLYVVPDEIIKVGEVALGKGDVLINGRPGSEYFPGLSYTKRFLEPYRTTNTIGRFATSIKVSGGGLVGQLGAVVHGISRAIEKVDADKFRPILKKRGFLTRDPRAKQRRKAGFAQKARAKKQSPKR